MYIGAEGFDLGDLHRRGDLWHEHARAYPEPAGGIGDRRAVIAARGCRATDRRRGAGQEIVERPARLERTRMLQEFEFERNPRRPGDRGRGLEQRRAPDMPRYARVRRLDFAPSRFMRSHRRSYIGITSTSTSRSRPPDESTTPSTGGTSA